MTQALFRTHTINLIVTPKILLHLISNFINKEMTECDIMARASGPCTAWPHLAAIHTKEVTSEQASCRRQGLEGDSRKAQESNVYAGNGKQGHACSKDTA